MRKPEATLFNQAAFAHLADRLFQPVDNSFLIFFRIFFGLAMLWNLWELYSGNQIASHYVDPEFHFTFYGFSWVRPWAGDGMYLHFAGLAMVAVFLTVGFLYRLSASLLFLGFAHVLLIDKALFLNHYYLMCLLCLLLVFLPAHRSWSVDAWLRPRLRSTTTPAWTLWLLRFQIGLPYLYGGLAKLKFDWLLGQPMQMWLSISVWRVLFGPEAAQPWLAILVSWAGAIFDLIIVPLLLWRRTRVLAFGGVVLFHLLNAFMFDIGVFPWLMIGATTVFFAPDWPRRFLSQPTSGSTNAAPTRQNLHKRRLVVALLVAFMSIQLLVPFRYLLYPDNILWTEQGYLFSWHMMLRAKVNALRFVITDLATGERQAVDPRRWLTPQQIESMGHDPEMIREFACHLRQLHRQHNRDVAVHVVALCSLNGRKPQLLIDPTVDLSRQPRTLLHQTYIVPLKEPFRHEPWTVPVELWEESLAR